MFPGNLGNKNATTNASINLAETKAEDTTPIDKTGTKSEVDTTPEQAHAASLTESPVHITSQEPNLHSTGSFSESLGLSEPSALVASGSVSNESIPREGTEDEILPANDGQLVPPESTEDFSNGSEHVSGASQGAESNELDLGNDVLIDGQASSAANVDDLSIGEEDLNVAEAENEESEAANSKAAEEVDDLSFGISEDAEVAEIAEGAEVVEGDGIDDLSLDADIIPENQAVDAEGSVPELPEENPEDFDAGEPLSGGNLSVGEPENIAPEEQDEFQEQEEGAPGAGEEAPGAGEEEAPDIGEEDGDLLGSEFSLSGDVADDAPVEEGAEEGSSLSSFLNDEEPLSVEADDKSSSFHDSELELCTTN